MIDDAGLLAARLVLGLGLAAHGAQKAFGWFDGEGPEGAAALMDELGFVPPRAYATAASFTQMGSGLALAAGVGGPVAPAVVISTMLVAVTSAHAKNGFFARKGGIELGALYATGALALASSGFGAFSLDRALRIDEPLRRGPLTALALGAAVGVGCAILSLRRPRAASDGEGSAPDLE